MPSLLESSTRLVALLSATLPSFAVLLIVSLFALGSRPRAGSGVAGALARGVASGAAPGAFVLGARATRGSLP